MVEVVGIDGKKGRGRHAFVCVHVVDGRLAAYRTAPTLASALEGARDAVAVALLFPAEESRRREALEAARGDARLVFADPERSFLEMRRARDPGAASLAHARATPAGIEERLALLHAEGLRPSRSMGGVGLVTPDAVLDATAAAWTAMRHARGEARRLKLEGAAGKGTGIPLWA